MQLQFWAFTPNKGLGNAKSWDQLSVLHTNTRVSSFPITMEG